MKKTILVSAIIFIFLTTFIGYRVNAQDFQVDIKSAILIDAETGQVLFEKNADEKLPPASVTKVMTLLIAMEKIDSGVISLDDEVTVSKFAESMGGSQIYLPAGARVKVEELLKAISIASANDACVAMAEAIAGSYNNFISMMNKRAQELGMKNSYFSNSTGLPTKTDHYSTARDISIMARELVKHKKILDWTSTWVDYVNLPDRKAMLANTNKLINKYPGMDGLKTGHTNAAGFCLVATAKRDTMRLISVILDAKSEQAREEITTKLLDYGFNRFTKQKVVSKGEEVHNVKIPTGKKTLTNGVAAKDLNVVVKRGLEKELKTRIKIKENLKAPIQKGDILGQELVYQGDKKIGEVNLVATENIGKANILVRLWRGFVNWIGSWLQKI